MYSKLGGVMEGGWTPTSHHLRLKQWLMRRPAVINLSVVVRAINGHSTTNGRAMPRLMRPSTFSSALSATASGAHPHPPTHAPHRTVMSLGLMHRTTQLEKKKKMFHSPLEPRHLHALESSLCRCGSWRASLTNPASLLCRIVCVLLEEAKQGWQLQPEALWPAAWWPCLRRQCCFAPAPFFSSLARKRWQFITKHTRATHTHTWICSSMPHLVWGLSWLRGRKKNSFLL